MKSEKILNYFLFNLTKIWHPIDAYSKINLWIKFWKLIKKRVAFLCFFFFNFKMRFRNYIFKFSIYRFNYSAELLSFRLIEHWPDSFTIVRGGCHLKILRCFKFGEIIFYEVKGFFSHYLVKKIDLKNFFFNFKILDKIGRESLKKTTWIF